MVQTLVRNIDEIKADELFFKNIGILPKAVALFVIYLGAAIISLNIYSVNNFVALLWPPTGIALAALVLYGYRLWPAIALGSFFLNLYIGDSILIALGIAVGSTIEVFIGAFFLRFFGFDPSSQRLRSSLGLIVPVSFFATAISATAGVTSLWLGGGNSIRYFF